LILILSLVVYCTALSDSEYLSAFEEFKTTHGKTYLPSEETYRFGIFKYHLDFVNGWDAKAKGFSVGINEFADLSLEEFLSIYTGVNVTRTYEHKEEQVEQSQVTGDIVNWVNKGAVTGVKNQGQCGSCWSFSATGSMEGVHFLSTGKLVSLSEQNLVDCSVPEGNQGCNGGWMDQAFKYVIANNGIDTEASYPYHATGPNACKYNVADKGATIASYTDVAAGSESGLQSGVDKQPVSVAIDAGHSSFQLYRSGVYYEPACSTTSLDHGVLAVGYGNDGATDYWIVKNSWGTSWGMAGYIHMSRNRGNNCGIASAASYPIA